MQTNQCFNNHWTFSASELCQAQVYRRNVYQRNGLPRVFPGAKGGREKFQGSEPWGVDLAQHMYYDLWILIMICAKLQSYKVTIFSAENAQMERLPAARAVRPNTDLPTYAFNFGGVVTYDKKLYYLWEARRWVSDGDLLPPGRGEEVAVGNPSASLDWNGRTCKQTKKNCHPTHPFHTSCSLSASTNSQVNEFGSYTWVQQVQREVGAVQRHSSPVRVNSPWQPQQWMPHALSERIAFGNTPFWYKNSFAAFSVMAAKTRNDFCSKLRSTVEDAGASELGPL